MPSCNGADTGFKVTRHESEQTSDWSFFAREHAEPMRKGREQKEALALPDAGAIPTWLKDWDSIEWSQLERQVRRLQVRIAKAAREERWGKIAFLQWVLTRSIAARLLAVLRVVTNKGKRTPGIDKVIWRTPRQKMQAVWSLKRRGYRPQPLRRIYIPKRNGKLITGCSREQLEEKVRPAVESFLSERGLRLSEEKTKMTSIEAGFDFLGANVRKYGDKLLIRPSKRNILDFLREIRRLIRTQKAATALDLIRQLNSKLRGWASQHKHLVSSRAFLYVERCVFQALWRWAKRRHPEKGLSWVRAKYYRAGSSPKAWIFSAPTRSKDGSPGFLDLFRVSSVPIRRHVKIQAEATAYDPAYDDYFRQRREKQRQTRARARAQARTQP